MLVGLVLAGSLLTAPPSPTSEPAEPQPTESEASNADADPPAREPDLERAEQLYINGQLDFETGNFRSAIARWEQAYRLVPRTNDSVVVRRELLHNMAEAHIQAHGTTGDATHLRRARALFVDYLAWHVTYYGNGKEALAHRARALALVDQIDRLLAGSAPAPPPVAAAIPLRLAPAPPSPPTKPTTYADARRARVMEIRNDPELRAANRRSKLLIAGGYTLAGVGAMVGLSTATFDDMFYEGDGRRGLAIFAASVSVGLGLAIAGHVKRKRLRRPQWTPEAPTIAASPWITRDKLGIGVTGRF